jgi:RNA polymerase sigma-70 factor (ECF subfamily)
MWAAARRGDATAFGTVFDEHRDRVFGQALRLMRSSHDAEDVTALVFLEAWRRRDSVRVVDGSIVAWLLVTTNNVVRNMARNRRRYRAALERIENETALVAPDGTIEVDERLDRADRDELVRGAFAELSVADQDVITLCVLEEFSTAQAAATLGVPEGTVKSRLSRAKRRLASRTEAALDGTASISGGGK